MLENRTWWKVWEIYVIWRKTEKPEEFFKNDLYVEINALPPVSGTVYIIAKSLVDK